MLIVEPMFTLFRVVVYFAQPQILNDVHQTKFDFAKWKICFVCNRTENGVKCIILRCHLTLC